MTLGPRFGVVDASALTGLNWRQRLTPLRSLSDLLGKRWMEGAVPLFSALLLSLVVLWATPVALGDAPLVLDDATEKGLLAIAMTVVLVGGGIDLSVGSMVACTSLGSLVAFRAWDWPMFVVVPAAIAAGCLLGAINGFMIGVLKMRPFITTLVTLVAFRGLSTALQSTYSYQLTFPKPDVVWDFLGEGAILQVPTGWLVFAVALVVVHVALTRSRWGWWVTAVGSDARAARRDGLPSTAVTFLIYVFSGALCGVAGLLTAARLGRTDADVGTGWELIALTAVVLGGVSLSGGRGSVLRATVGILVVGIIQQATIASHAEGATYTVALAGSLFVFALLDLKWGKYRGRAVEKLKVAPGQIALGPLVDVTSPGNVWAINSGLTRAQPVGLGAVEGPEDCAIDEAGAMYCGDRRGWIWRFSGADQSEREVFARTGGFPLGHAWDRDQNLVVAIGGMGVYRIAPDGQPELVANRVKRSRMSLLDDSALRTVDDLDVAPDGSIYVSDFSTRYTQSEWLMEIVENRPNGRVVRIDPDGSTEVVARNLVFPNGVSTAHDGKSVLIASTGLCRVDRLWISGDKQGQLEPLLENLPGHPDNLNRASDGNYWMTFVAMRTPMSDLLARYPDVRRRMTREMPAEHWIVPQMNVSCVLKFNDKGEILKVLWDSSLQNYPMVTSVNERQGHLYLSGINNNRIGRLRLDPVEVGSIDPGRVPGVTAGPQMAMEGRR